MYDDIINNFYIEDLISYINPLQKEIVENKSRLIIINGCAGSRKTDTIIKKGIYELIINNKNILFITFVSSVSNEIKNRIETTLNITIPKISNSNHYLTQYKNNFIEISNIDAWIHKQIQYIYKEFNINLVISNNYNQKVIDLINLSKQFNFFNFVLKNNFFADVILIDEFQDTDSNKVDLINLLINNNKDISCIVAGDLLQTIFISNLSNKNYINPMILFKNNSKVKSFEINTCFRCPYAHIEFVNYLIGEYYIENNLNPIISANNNNIDKPVLFMHGSTSNNHSTFKLAECISNTIIEILKIDPEIKPDDIAIIMKKSNNNYVFEQIKTILKNLYKINNIDYSIIHFETNGDGYSTTIDWNKAIEKTILLSIHGDKGKGHKVVFFLGLTKNSIPAEYNVLKPYEIFDISLLNVALTRSLKYLFIGFTENYPSIYLSNKYEKLNKYCYLAWDNYNHVYPYVNIINKLNYYWFDNLPSQRKNPKFKEQIKSNLKIPSKLCLRIREDISKDMSNYFDDIINYCTIETECIDIYEDLKYEFDQEYYVLFGYIGELLLIRNDWINKKYYSIFSDFNNIDIYFINNDSLENLIIDCNLNKYVNNYLLWKDKLIELEFNIYNDYNYNSNLLEEIKYINNLDKPVLILKKLYESFNIKQILKIFCSNLSNDLLIKDSINIIIISILYIELNSQIKKSCLIVNIVNFINNKKINIIINQINNNVNIIWNKFFINSKINYQKNLYLEKNICDKNKLISYGYDYYNDRNIFKKGMKISISGIIDILDENNNNLFEIKTCLKTQFSNEWVIQLIVYNLLLKLIFNIDCNNNYIINLFDGTIYKINFGSDMNILNKILRIYDFDCYLENLLLD